MDAWKCDVLEVFKVPLVGGAPWAPSTGAETPNSGGWDRLPLSLECSLVHVGMPFPFVIHRRGKPWYLITLMCTVI